MNTPATGKFEDPHTVIVALLVRSLRRKYPFAWFSKKLKSSAEAHMGAVTDFIATIGRGLDAANGERFALTENGVLKRVIVDGYHTRLPVLQCDLPRFEQALTRLLYQHVATAPMTLGCAELTLEQGELVVVPVRSTAHSLADATPVAWTRATVFIPD